MIIIIIMGITPTRGKGGLRMCVCVFASAFLCAVACFCTCLHIPVRAFLLPLWPVERHKSAQNYSNMCKKRLYARPSSAIPPLACHQSSPPTKSNRTMSFRAVKPHFNVAICSSVGGAGRSGWKLDSTSLIPSTLA